MAETRPGYRAEPWTPAYDFAVGDRGLLDPKDHPPASGKPYEPAPPSSHLYGWKLIADGREGLKRFVKDFYAPAVGAPPGTRALIAVAFKDRKSGSIDTQYEYYFTSAATAETYLEKFRAAEHPGHVVQLLIAAAVPYKKIR